MDRKNPSPKLREIVGSDGSDGSIHNLNFFQESKKLDGAGIEKQNLSILGT